MHAGASCSQRLGTRLPSVPGKAKAKAKIRQPNQTSHLILLRLVLHWAGFVLLFFFSLFFSLFFFFFFLLLPFSHGETHEGCWSNRALALSGIPFFSITPVSWLHFTAER